MRKCFCPCGRRVSDVSPDLTGIIRDTCRRCKQTYLLICSAGGVRSVLAADAGVTTADMRVELH
jgi:hypothetical protein